MENERIIEIIKNSPNRLQTLIKLGWNTQTMGYKRLKKFIKKNNINISHFESQSEKMKRLQNTKIIQPKYKLDDILVENSDYLHTNTLKQRLYKEGIKKRECELCGQGEMWRGKKMSLILDHVNGIYDDNRLENLRIVCPNCNATLDTHCGKNVAYKKKTIKKEVFSYTKELYMKNHFPKRKAERPTFEVLKKEIYELGYRGTGKKYGVSDVAIRKWIKAYEKYGI